MSYHTSTWPYRLAAVLVGAGWRALLGCDHTPSPGPVGCGYVVNLALLSPSFPQVHIGNTLTMRATWDRGVARECLPPDTTAAGLWWWSERAEVTIDSQGHLTAVHPGLGAIFLSQKGDSRALGQTSVGVFEPAGADSVVTIIRNGFTDSVRVMLQDANGALQRSQTVAVGDSTCWVTPLSDSLRYSAVAYVRPPAGPDSAAAQWITQSTLAYLHTFRIQVYSDAPAVPAWEPLAVSPDPGTGC
jgi:hypothetical protein